METLKMIYVSLGFLVGCLLAMRAWIRDGRPGIWFLYGLFLTPIAFVHFVILAAMLENMTDEEKDLAAAKGEFRCLYCHRPIPGWHRLCRLCWRPLPKRWAWDHL